MEILRKENLKSINIENLNIVLNLVQLYKEKGEEIVNLTFREHNQKFKFKKNKLNVNAFLNDIHTFKTVSTKKLDEDIVTIEKWYVDKGNKFEVFRKKISY